MKTELVRASSVLGALATFVLACGSAAESPAPPATTTSALVTNDDAINKITDARCKREEACNNIGAGKHYPDKNACVRELSHDARADLRPENCGPIDTNKLNVCVSSIGDEKCGNPLDTLSRVVACRQKELCLPK